MHLSGVLESMGEVAGERFGLDPRRAMHFGQWLAQAVTGWRSDLSDDDEIDTLNALAGRAVYGRDTAIGFAWTHADWWIRYQRAIAADSRSLRGCVGQQAHRQVHGCNAATSASMRAKRRVACRAINHKLKP
jgi:hypothetical protein